MRWSGTDTWDTCDVLFWRRIRFWVGSIVPIQNIHFREIGINSGDGWRRRRPHQPFPLSLSCGPLCHSHYLPIIFTLLILNSLQNIFLLVVNCSAGDCAHTASAYSVLRSTSGSACGQLLYTSAFWSKYLHHKSLEISFWVCCKKRFSFMIGFVKCWKEGSEKRLSCLIFEHKGNYHSIYLEG